MKWYTYLLIAGLFYGIHTKCSHRVATNETNDRKSYVRTINSNIYDLTKNLDHLMHKKAFIHDPQALKELHMNIKSTRYKRDILIQHLRDLRKHGFEQIHQI